MRTIIFETEGVEHSQAPSIKHVHFFYDTSMWRMPHCSTPIDKFYLSPYIGTIGQCYVRLGILQKIKKWLWNIFAC